MSQDHLFVQWPCRLTCPRHSTRSTTTPSSPSSQIPPYATTLSGGCLPTFAVGLSAAGTTTFHPHTDTCMQESHKAPAYLPHFSTTLYPRTHTHHISQHLTLMTLQTPPPIQIAHRPRRPSTSTLHVSRSGPRTWDSLSPPLNHQSPYSLQTDAKLIRILQ